MMRNTTRSFVSLASMATVALGMVLSLAGCPADESDKPKPPATEAAKPAEKAVEVPAAAPTAPAPAEAAAKPEAAKPEAATPPAAPTGK